MAVAEPRSPRRTRSTRADGAASREKILAAATQIAAERGYEGTSIAAVSGACGLPASSIYWHFTDKDDLLAAVIERSFASWLTAWDLPEMGVPLRRAEVVAAQIAKALLASPDFLRLGLMLALERRPREPRARAMYVDARRQAHDALVEGITGLAPELAAEQVQHLARYAMAGADGLFIAHEIDAEDLDLIAMFRMHAQAVYQAAVHMIAQSAA